MWRINYKSSTLQEVLILAYMNILEAGVQKADAQGRGKNVTKF